ISRRLDKRPLEHAVPVNVSADKHGLLPASRGLHHRRRPGHLSGRVERDGILKWVPRPCPSATIWTVFDRSMTLAPSLVQYAPLGRNVRKARPCASNTLTVPPASVANT